MLNLTHRPIRPRVRRSSKVVTTRTIRESDIRPGDIRIETYPRDYVLSKAVADRMTTKVLDTLTDTYTTDDGATTFQGQSLSHVIAEVRYAGFVVPGRGSGLSDIFEALGFRIVRARGRRIYHGGKYGYGVECDCVTV